MHAQLGSCVYSELIECIMNGCAGDDGIVVADDDSDFDAYENARYMVNQCQNIS